MIAPDGCLSGIAHLPLLMQIVIYQKLASPFIHQLKHTEKHHLVCCGVFCRYGISQAIILLPPQLKSH